MQAAITPRTLWWFFLIWIGTIYIEGTMQVMTTTTAACPAKQVAPCYMAGAAASLLAIQLSFTLLMVLFYGVLWLSLARQSPQHFLRRIFPIQILLIVAIFFVVRQEAIALDLYLALALVAVTVCKQPNRVVIVSVASGYMLVLFALFGVLWLTTGPIDKVFSSAFLPDLSQYGTQALFLIGYMVLYQQIMRSQEELRASNEHIAALTQLAERQRMARELHDTLVQGLTGVILQLEAVQAGLRQQRYERVQAIIAQALIDVRGSLTDARTAIQDLRVARLTAVTLPAFMQREVEHFAAMTGIAYTTNLAGLAALPNASCEQISRMLTEALTNVARHAQATALTIEACADAAQVHIVVCDDGKGFDPTHVVHEAGHYGLVGMQERARVIGGQIAVVSAPTQGTTISISVPRSVIDIKEKIGSDHGRSVDA